MSESKKSDKVLSRGEVNCDRRLTPEQLAEIAARTKADDAVPFSRHVSGDTKLVYSDRSYLLGHISALQEEMKWRLGGAALEVCDLQRKYEHTLVLLASIKDYLENPNIISSRATVIAAINKALGEGGT